VFWGLDYGFSGLGFEFRIVQCSSIVYVCNIVCRVLDIENAEIAKIEEEKQAAAAAAAAAKRQSAESRAVVTMPSVLQIQTQSSANSIPQTLEP
jgi:hypothetical protein